MYNSKLRAEKYRSDKIVEYGLDRTIKKIQDTLSVEDLDFEETLFKGTTTIGALTIDFNITSSSSIYFYKPENDIKMWNMTPDIDDVFEVFVHKIPYKTPLLSVAGDLNKGIRALDFYSVSYKFEDSTLYIHKYIPYIDDAFSEEASVPLADITPECKITSKALWNSLKNSYDLYFTVYKPSQHKLSLYVYQPYIDGTINLLTEYTNPDMLDISFDGSLQKGLNTAELFLGIVTPTKISVLSMLPDLDDEFGLVPIWKRDTPSNYYSFDIDCVWYDDFRDDTIYIALSSDNVTEVFDEDYVDPIRVIPERLFNISIGNFYNSLKESVEVMLLGISEDVTLKVFIDNDFTLMQEITSIECNRTSLASFYGEIGESLIALSVPIFIETSYILTGTILGELPNNLSKSRLDITLDVKIIYYEDKTPKEVKEVKIK